MTVGPPSDGPADATAVPEAANLGLARPPLVYLGLIVLGLVLHWIWPVWLGLPRVVGAPLGAAAVLAAVVIFVQSVAVFRASGTPVPGDQPTTVIVRKGPYRFSRNPIYLAFTLLQVGIALLVGALWLLVTLVPAVALMAGVVIPREERYLAARFPSDYLPYKASVRRWL